MPLEPRPGNVAWPPGAIMTTRDAAAGDRALAPPGLRLAPDSGTRLVAGGSVLVGGSPVRVLRLTPAGARQVASWFAGAPVPSGAGARTLARRLLDAGIAYPDFAASGGPTGDPGTAGVRSSADPVGANGAGRRRFPVSGAGRRDGRDPRA